MASQTVGPGPAIQAQARWVHFGRCLAAGVLAGIVAWMAGEAIHGVFAPQLLSSFNIEGGEMNQRVVSSERLEATLAFGILGACLGLALGLAGGRGRSRITGGSVGMVLGALAGSGVAWILLAFYYGSVNRDVDDLILPLLTHGGIWGAAGAAGGLAFGIGHGERRRIVPAIVGGLFGALAATLVYDVVGGLAFPLARTSEPLSQSWATRLLARLLVACCAAAGVALAVQGVRTKSTSVAEVS